MDVKDLQRQGLAIDERLRVPEPLSEDGMERESIRRGVNFSWALEMLHDDHDQVEYKHGLDEDLLRRQESLLPNQHHHNHPNGQQQQQQQHYEEEDHQQMLGSGGNIQAYNHSDDNNNNNGEGAKHNFYKWG